MILAEQKRAVYHVLGCFAADGACNCHKLDPAGVTLLSKSRLLDDALAVVHANYRPFANKENK